MFTSPELSNGKQQIPGYSPVTQNGSRFMSNLSHSPCPTPIPELGKSFTDDDPSRDVLIPHCPEDTVLSIELGEAGEAPQAFRRRSFCEAQAGREKVDEGDRQRECVTSASSKELPEEGQNKDLMSSLKIVYELDNPALAAQWSGDRHDDTKGVLDVERSAHEQVDNFDAVPDGGYGWFVVLGCFLFHVILGALERGDGVFFLQFSSRFRKSAQLTAWPGALAATLIHVMSPVASVLSNRYSIRACVITGGLIVFIALLLDGLAPEFFVLFFSHSVLQGLGMGLAYVPSLIAVGEYFDKHRSLAAGLGTSGVGLGSFLITPCFQRLFDEYEYRGAFFVIAAFALNLVLVGMLLRPLSLHRRFMKAKRKVTRMSDKQCEKNYPMEDYHHIPNGYSNSFGKSQNDSLLDTVTSTSVHHYKREQERCFRTCCVICLPVEPRRHRKRTRMFDWKLMKNPSFSLFCVTIWLCTVAYKSTFTFIPALVISRGFSAREAAFVLSVSGAVDTLARVGVGLLLDLPRIRPFRPFLVNFLLFAAGAVTFSLPFLRDFSAICVVSGLFGLIVGVYLSQKTVIAVDILGIENMASSFGILVSFQGLGMFMGPPLSGALTDSYGSFDASLFMGAASMIIAGLLTTVSNFLFHK